MTREVDRASAGYWFRPQRIGFGAVPVTWQGWLACLALATVGALIGKFAQAHGTIWLVLWVPLAAGFLLLSRAKTDGEWRWRWGGDE